MGPEMQEQAVGIREINPQNFSKDFSEIVVNKHREGENPYLSIRDFAKQYSTWTESSIRWLIYNNTEGFEDMVVRRVGKVKILLSVSDFWKWIEVQNSNRKVNI